jgi:hypothetical protein
LDVHFLRTRDGHPSARAPIARRTCGASTPIHRRTNTYPGIDAQCVETCSGVSIGPAPDANQIVVVAPRGTNPVVSTERHPPITLAREQWACSAMDITCPQNIRACSHVQPLAYSTHVELFSSDEKAGLQLKIIALPQPAKHTASAVNASPVKRLIRRDTTSEALRCLLSDQRGEIEAGVLRAHRGPRRTASSPARVSNVTLDPGETRVLLACACNADGQCNNGETAASCAHSR